MSAPTPPHCDTCNPNPNGRPHEKDPSYVTPYERFFRFSFGPLLPETFDGDIAIMKEVLEAYKAECGTK